MFLSIRPRALAWVLFLIPLPALAGDALDSLLRERLLLMRDVAAWKWHHAAPVEDPEREAAVVEHARDAALFHGLIPDTVADLFLVQIEAAKDVQRHWLEVWGAGHEPPPEAPDLVAETRPALTRLGDAIVAAAADRSARPDRAMLEGALQVEGLDAQRRETLVAAVQAVAAYPHRLAQVLATGRLRVGTTGDYAPFSHRDDGAAGPAGIDIDLARDLAAAMGVDVEFVATSWPGLLDDLAAGRYDIAMGGVSRSVARQRAGFLSVPYYADGKTPIARCADRRRYAAIERIDRPDVRVIVNPGGTNEAFVASRIHQATRIVHPDNRTIFTEILEGRADVMFTDRIEVELRTRLHPGLCASLRD
jgi:cyclohexadienyl dehydratase